MGLFSFIKNIGMDLFKGGDEAEEVKEMLTKEFGDSSFASLNSVMKLSPTDG